MWKKNVITAIALVAVIFLLSLLPCGMSLTVKDPGGRVYFMSDIQPGDFVALGFTHSVEKVPVVDTFQVTAAGSLMAVNTTYGSMGAGLPSDESYNITSDDHGNFTINNINETFETVNFITSEIPKHYLSISGKIYPLYTVVPAEKPLILSVERNRLYNKLFNTIRTYI